MNGYNAEFADFITVTTAKNESGKLSRFDTNLGRAFIEIVKNETDKASYDSSQRIQKVITFDAYVFVRQMITDNTMVLINGERYGNLRVTPIIGSKTKIRITAEI